MGDVFHESGDLCGFQGGMCKEWVFGTPTKDAAVNLLLVLGNGLVMWKSIIQICCKRCWDELYGARSV